MCDASHERYSTFESIIDEALECFKSANQILHEMTLFEDFRCMMALIGLEMIFIKKLIHGKNLEKKTKTPGRKSRELKLESIRDDSKLSMFLEV